MSIPFSLSRLVVCETRVGCICGENFFCFRFRENLVERQRILVACSFA